MFDFLDMENLRDENVLDGSYYSKKPTSPSDFSILFSYSMIDPMSWEYGKVMGNLRSDAQRTAIRTNEDCKWKIGGYVCAQDGSFFVIEGVSKSTESKSNRESLRVLKQTVDTDFVLRLLLCDNPWGLE